MTEFIDEYGRDADLCSASDNEVDDEPCFENECENCKYYYKNRVDK